MSRSLLVLILSFNCGSIVAQTQPNKWLPLEPRATQEVSGETCSGLWFVSKNGQCRCGASIHDVVQCNEDTKSVMILDCYCMTPKSTTQDMVIGECFYNCVNMSQQYRDYVYHEAPSICDHLHRNGTLCGQCDYSSGYYPRAYSYDMNCMQCKQPHSWWLYFAVAFLPLTLFIVIIFLLRISVASPGLRAFVCFAQMFASPIQLRIFLLSSTYTTPLFAGLTKAFATAYGIWNLDFFRTVLSGVCLHLTTLQVLALDYVIAVYPMLLMVFAYILVELHSHGFRPLLLLWKPFHYFFVRFRREWNIQTSLVDTFVTFFILSATKLFSVSFDLLIPTILHSATGSSERYFLYYDANIKYMKHEHLYYALLAMAVLGVFFLLPLSLMALSCFRNFFTIRIRVLQEFLHALQKFYKDGTNGTRDCRWFAGYYIFSLFGIYILYSVTLTGFMYQLAIIYCTILAVIVLLVEPYKEEYALYNTLDCVLFLWQAVFAASITFMNHAGMLQRYYFVFGCITVVLTGTVPTVYISVVIVRWLQARILRAKSDRVSDFNESLAHRITNSSEYKDNCGYVNLQINIQGN